MARWVAQLFTWGSVMWVLNGHFLFFPGQGPSANFNLYITSYTALVGGTLFWFGAYFAIIEALNIAEEVCPAMLPTSNTGMLRKKYDGEYGVYHGRN